MNQRSTIISLILVGLSFYLGLRFSVFKPQTTAVSKIDELAQASDVLPVKVDLKVAFGDVIVKMVKNGAIDRDKFLKRHPEATNMLENSDSKSIVVTSENSALLLNLLWPLGIANKSRTLAEGPMGTQYKDQVGNFASTGGWTLGSLEGGKLFNSLNLIEFTLEQEELVKSIASNIYRPCCGNNTAFPDCNHGAAMLGFIELAVASKMPESEIYKKALALNSYWFPQTYTELAVYFKAKKNVSWKKVNPKEVLGEGYSGGKGYSGISQQLQAEGLVPQAKSGGSCGV